MRSVSKFILTAAVVLWASGMPVYGAISACAVSAGTAVPSPVASTNGCASVDLNYVNISITPGGNALGTLAKTDYWGVGGTINTAPVPDVTTTSSLHLAGSTSGGDWTARNATNSLTLGFQANANNGSNAPDSGYSWAITGLKFAPTFDAALSTGEQLQAIINLCFAATSTSCSAAQNATFTATWTSLATNITSASNLGLNATTLNGVVNLALPNSTFSNVYIQTQLSFTVGGTKKTLTDWSVGFDQTAVTPEPSTFGLLGVALAALGARIKYRTKGRTR